MSDGPEWFAPRRYGLGSGLPIAWQGWLVLALYLAVFAAAVYFLGEDSAAFVATIVIATAVMLVIAARTTKGGWRWRWGRED